MKRFWALHRIHRFTPCQVAVFTALATEWALAGKPDKFQLDSRYFERTLDMSRKTLKTSRDRLVECGLIELKKGEGRGASTYKMTFSETDSEGLKSDAVCVTSHSRGNTKLKVEVTQNFEDNDHNIKEKESEICVTCASRGNTKLNSRGNTNEKVASDTSLINIYNKEYNINNHSSDRKRARTREGNFESDSVENSPPPVFSEVSELAKQEIWLESMAKNHKKSVDELKELLPKFAISCVCEGIPSHDSERDLKNHFGRWLRVKENIQNGKDRTDKPRNGGKGNAARLAPAPGYGLAEGKRGSA